ncbi:MAG: hypothetical protein K5924_05645 [Chloroflexi bacterium]|nr:hypothetical protein [Chloroflexota bacterium]
MGAYLTMLVGSYVLVISQTYYSSGMVNLVVGDGSLTVAIALAWAPVLAMPTRIDRPSQGVSWLLYVLTYIPAQVIPAFVLGSGWALLPLNIALLAGMVMLLLGQRIPVPQLPRPSISPIAYQVAIGACALLLVTVAAAWFGVSLSLPSITDVATTRDDYREEIAGAPRVVGYAVGWAGRVLLPTALAAGLWWRKWWLVALALTGELYIYSVSGFRSLFLVVGITLGLLLMIRFFGKRWGLMLPWIAAGGIALAALPLAVGERLPISLFVRRLIDVPGQVTGYYFDYFSTNPPYLLGHSVLGWLFDPPHASDPASVIGTTYFHDPRVHANGNLWADGLANFGLPGILLVSGAAVAILFAMDVAARGRATTLAIAMLGAASLSLTNSGLLTSIATHGLAIAILAVALLPRHAPAGSTVASGSQA